MLFPVMIVQPGDQVYGGNPAHQYLWYPGAVPCTDSANPNRTVYCVARVDSRQADGAETITWVPVIEEITPGRVFRAYVAGGIGVAAGQLRLSIGHDECLSPAADLAAGAKRSRLGRRRPGGDGQFHELHSYRHGAPVGRRHLQRALWPGNARGVGQYAAQRTPFRRRRKRRRACGRFGV